MCVCISFLDARAQQQGKDEGKKWKPQKGRGGSSPLFLFFFCLSLSLTSIFFLLKFSFFFLMRSFFQEEPTKTLQKTTPQTTLRFARVYTYCFIYCKYNQKTNATTLFRAARGWGVERSREKDYAVFNDKDTKDAEGLFLFFFFFFDREEDDENDERRRRRRRQRRGGIHLTKRPWSR